MDEKYLELLLSVRVSLSKSTSSKGPLLLKQAGH